LIARLRSRIVEVAAAHGASNVRLFGSTARGDDRPDSDIDLLVHLGPDVGLFGLGRLEGALESLLSARVDVIPDDGLKPAVGAAAEQDLIPL
jgi:predicted nucleotidyltransferase